MYQPHGHRPCLKASLCQRALLPPATVEGNMRASRHFAQKESFVYTAASVRYTGGHRAM
jgi:hypothetical protein